MVGVLGQCLCHGLPRDATAGSQPCRDGLSQAGSSLPLPAEKRVSPAPRTLLFLPPTVVPSSRGTADVLKVQEITKTSSSSSCPHWGHLELWAAAFLCGSCQRNPGQHLAPINKPRASCTAAGVSAEADGHEPPHHPASAIGAQRLRPPPTQSPRPSQGAAGAQYLQIPHESSEERCLREVPQPGSNLPSQFAQL